MPKQSRVQGLKTVDPSTYWSAVESAKLPASTALPRSIGGGSLPSIQQSLTSIYRSMSVVWKDKEDKAQAKEEQLGRTAYLEGLTREGLKEEGYDSPYARAGYEFARGRAAADGLSSDMTVAAYQLGATNPDATPEDLQKLLTDLRSDYVDKYDVRSEAALSVYDQRYEDLAFRALNTFTEAIKKSKMDRNEEFASERVINKIAKVSSQITDMDSLDQKTFNAVMIPFMEELTASVPLRGKKGVQTLFVENFGTFLSTEANDIIDAMSLTTPEFRKKYKWKGSKKDYLNQLQDKQEFLIDLVKEMSLNDSGAKLNPGTKRLIERTIEVIPNNMVAVATASLEKGRGLQEWEDLARYYRGKANILLDGNPSDSSGFNNLYREVYSDPSLTFSQRETLVKSIKLQVNAELNPTADESVQSQNVADYLANAQLMFEGEMTPREFLELNRLISDGLWIDAGAQYPKDFWRRLQPLMRQRAFNMMDGLKNERIKGDIKRWMGSVGGIMADIVGGVFPAIRESTGGPPTADKINADILKALKDEDYKPPASNTPAYVWMNTYVDQNMLKRLSETRYLQELEAYFKDSFIASGGAEEDWMGDFPLVGAAFDAAADAVTIKGWTDRNGVEHLDIRTQVIKEIFKNLPPEAFASGKKPKVRPPATPPADGDAAAGAAAGAAADAAAGAAAGAGAGDTPREDVKPGVQSGVMGSGMGSQGRGDPNTVSLPDYNTAREEPYDPNNSILIRDSVGSVTFISGPVSIDDFMDRQKVLKTKGNTTGSYLTESEAFELEQLEAISPLFQQGVGSIWQVIGGIHTRMNPLTDVNVEKGILSLHESYRLVSENPGKYKAGSAHRIRAKAYLAMYNSSGVPEGIRMTGENYTPAVHGSAGDLNTYSRWNWYDKDDGINIKMFQEEYLQLLGVETGTRPLSGTTRPVTSLFQRLNRGGELTFKRVQEIYHHVINVERFKKLSREATRDFSNRTLYDMIAALEDKLKREVELN